MPETKKTAMEVLVPLNGMVVIRKDEDSSETAGGIVLPDNCEIPNLTGRVVAIDEELESPRVSLYDRVLFNPHRAIKADFENKTLFLIPYKDLLAVIKKGNEDE